MPDTDKPAPAPKAAPVRSVLDWRAAKGTAEWLFRSTCIRVGWVTDPQVQPTECTESDFDSAVHITAHVRI